MTKEEALKLALDALRMADELCRGHGVDFKEYGLEFDKDIQIKYREAITAIEEALAQPAQETVADAARYQHIKGMARAMSLDISGNHYWHMTLGAIRGPNLDEAIDRAIKAEGQA